MTIGQAARASGLPAKTIRYYEEAGLLRNAPRAHNGYRRYDPKDVEVLRFIKRSRDLGFTVKEVESLLALWQDRRRASAQVKALAEARIADVDRRIAALNSIRATLSHLVHCCHGDQRPECPILDQLSGALPEERS